MFAVWRKRLKEKVSAEYCVQLLVDNVFGNGVDDVFDGGDDVFDGVDNVFDGDDVFDGVDNVLDGDNVFDRVDNVFDGGVDVFICGYSSVCIAVKCYVVFECEVLHSLLSLIILPGVDGCFLH
jgi:hypothetical protein